LRLALALAGTLALAGVLAYRHPGRRVIVLRPGVIELNQPVVVSGFTELAGRGTIVRAGPRFQGRALFEVHGGANVLFRDLIIDGNRAVHEQRTGLPPHNVSFSRFTRANGILALDAANLRIRRVRFHGIAGFAVLAARCRYVAVEESSVENSGSRASNGRNNATGGILFEGGTRFFKVTHSSFRNVRGNAVWTHSRASDARNAAGFIAHNRFDTIGRDAIQIGHATGVEVSQNTGVRIGYPIGEVDAVPVGIDTAGNVERTAYRKNRFENVNGKCIDLDGFHHGQVVGNTCAAISGGYGIVMNNSNPEMQSEGVVIAENEVRDARWGAVFVIGSGNRIERNRFTNLNTARCGCIYSKQDPDLLNAGIYLGAGAERPAPAHGNVIRDNFITGYGMNRHCVLTAPGIDPAANTIVANTCREQASAGESP
jgi:hypothetical protein